MAKPRTSYFWWVFGKVLYVLLGVGICAMTAFLVWRIYFSGLLPKEMKELVANERLAEVYAEKGDALVLFTQEQSTHTRGDSNYGYFAVPRFVFIPEAEQVQVIFRYNNSTLKYTQERYGLSERPPRGEEIFDVSLVTVTDLTPDTKEDNEDGSDTLGKTRIMPTGHTMTTTALYTYFCYTFDGVSVTDDLIAVFFDIYYEEDINYEKAAYGTLRLYHNESENLYETISSASKEALAAYGG